MDTYNLARTETLTLCTLLHLPVQAGSILSNWLGAGKLPDGPSQQDLDTLAAKGCYQPASPAAPFPVELVSSLTVAALNAAELTVTASSGKTALLTRFGQVGEGLVEYGIDGDVLTLHPVKRCKEVVERFLPEKLEVAGNEQVNVELPLGAFLLFRQACLASDLAFVDARFKSAAFKKSTLLELFQEGESWVDVLNAEGMQGVMSIEQMPVDAYLNQLIAMGYLQGELEGKLEIGEAGKALKQALSDPDQRALTYSLYIWGAGYPETGTCLYGGGRLFLLGIQPGVVAVRQLAGREELQSWVAALLEKGRHACHKTLTLAPVAKKEPARAPAAAKVTKKKKVSRPLVIASVLALVLACCLVLGGGAALWYGLAGRSSGVSLLPAAEAAIPACPGASLARLHKGGQARVVDVWDGNDLILFKQPIAQSVDSQRVGAVPLGDVVNVLDSPRCVEGIYWWLVESNDGEQNGWAAEAVSGEDGLYFLEPVP